MGEAVAIGCLPPVGETLRPGKAPVDPGLVVPVPIDEALPGQHVVERGRNAGISRPENPVCRGKIPDGLVAFVADEAIGRGRRVRQKFGCRHVRRIEQMGAVEFAQGAAAWSSMMSDRMRKLPFE